MNLLNFVEEYPDESSCRAKWKSIRDKQGVVCPKCKSTEHFGKRIKKVMSVRNVVVVKVYAVIQLCTAPIYPFAIGLLLFIC